MSKMTTETRDRLVWMAHVVNQALVTEDEEVARVAIGDILHEAGRAGTPAHSADVATERVAETRPYSGEFFTPKSVLDALAGTPAHSADVATETEKKRTPYEFGGMRLVRFAHKDHVDIIGKRIRGGVSHVWKIEIKRESLKTGLFFNTGVVTCNDKRVFSATRFGGMSALERFMVSGLHGYIKRKDAQQSQRGEKRKAKKAKSAAHSADRLHDREGM